MALPVLLEEDAMPASQVLLHLLLLQTRCPTEEAACKKLIWDAGVCVAEEGGRRQHSLSCRRGEDVDPPMLCCKVHLQGVQALQELRRFACQACERVARVCHNHLKSLWFDFQYWAYACLGPIPTELLLQKDIEYRGHILWIISTYNCELPCFTYQFSPSLCKCEIYTNIDTGCTICVFKCFKRFLDLFSMIGYHSCLNYLVFLR